MGDNYSGGDDHLSQWFIMSQQHQQAHPQQFQGQPQQMMQAPIADDRNMFIGGDSNPVAVPGPAAIDHSQHQPVEGASLNHQNYYPPPQYADPSQQPSHPAQQPQQSAYQQAFQQQGMYHPQLSPQQYPQHQQQQPQTYADPQERLRVAQGGLRIDLTSEESSAGMNSSRGSDSTYPSSLFTNYEGYPPQQTTSSMEPPPVRGLHAQRINGDKIPLRSPRSPGGGSNHSTTGTSVNGNPNATTIAVNRSKARADRKRTREKQRRDGVNRQFTELTKVLKRLELEEREEAERKARMAAGNDGSMSNSLHSVRLPFIAPNNSVDLIACAIVHLQHLHRMSKRQQEDLNRIEDELQIAKKAGEDTATKLKEVLFNYQIPRPHLGMTNPSFNVGKTSSKLGSKNVSNVGMNINNNSNNSNTTRMMTTTNGNNGNTTMSAPMSMSTMMSGGSQQKQQVMMMVPVMMNMNGTASVMGQGSSCNMQGMVMQSMPAGSSSSNTNSFPSATQGATTTTSSTGSTQSSSTISHKQSPQQRYQIASQQQQQPLRQDSTNAPKAAQQQIVVQLQQQYLQRQSQPIARSASQESGAPVQQVQQQQVHQQQQQQQQIQLQQQQQQVQQQQQQIQQQQQQIQQQQQQLGLERTISNCSVHSAPTTNTQVAPTSASQPPATEPGQPPAASPATGVFAVALAAALSNLRGGKEDSQEDQQQQQHQQLQTPVGAGAANLSDVPVNASTSDHAAALGSAIAAMPITNPIPPVANPLMPATVATTSTDPGNNNGTMSSVATACGQKEAPPAPQ